MKKTAYSLLYLAIIALIASRHALAGAQNETVVSDSSSVISDFERDIAQNKNNTSSASSSVIEAIRNGDFKTSWDEGGVNILVDGAAEISKTMETISEDIASGKQSAEAYVNAENQYLQDTSSTPAEVTQIETGAGDDIQSNDAQNQFAPATSTEEVSPTEFPMTKESVSPETETAATSSPPEETTSTSGRADEPVITAPEIVLPEGTTTEQDKNSEATSSPDLMQTNSQESP